ncbi:biotin transporter BioY [Pseudemcibacter aquimaris]|uniref:biotin transporter BioY n=1 Tax=Pseudemcibacter aquimaris TaxID=2857064 RepID=UPI0020118495|nr:biotin transporter BioY [Pseudemcibacter aquimaris]MCC3859760.1 biotin transporter BioY [Pseudemcibacter aquimaris]WDU60154.1 biotin transporter BioY [Pseudemcibacter aquimaris]
MIDKKQISFSFIFAILITIGAYLSLDVGYISFTLQTLFIFIAGLTLSRIYAVLAVLIYLLAGAIGLPVFSGGSSGLGVFTGPTAGFLVGFPIAAGFMAHISRDVQYKVGDVKLSPLYIKAIIYSFIGSFIIQIFGILWGKQYTGNSWSQVYFDYMHPFYLNLSVKAILAGIIAVQVWRLIDKRSKA